MMKLLFCLITTFTFLFTHASTSCRYFVISSQLTAQEDTTRPSYLPRSAAPSTTLLFMYGEMGNGV